MFKSTLWSTTGRITIIKPQPFHHLPKLTTPFIRPITSGHPILIFNLFLAEVLTEGHEINGLLTPTKYSINTYGYYKPSNSWYKLTLQRNSGYVKFNGWQHRWRLIETEKVPAEYRAKCMLLASTI